MYPIIMHFLIAKQLTREFMQHESLIVINFINFKTVALTTICK